jgi:hypothetical protein
LGGAIVDQGRANWFGVTNLSFLEPQTARHTTFGVHRFQACADSPRSFAGDAVKVVETVEIPTFFTYFFGEWEL